MRRTLSHPVPGLLLNSVVLGGMVLGGVVLAVCPLAGLAQVCPPAAARPPAKGIVCAKSGAPCSPVTDGIGSTGKCTTEGSPADGTTCECKGAPAPSYALTLSPFTPPSLTDPAGGVANSTVTVTPLNGYTGSINLTCTVSGGHPPLPSCPNPSSVTVTGGAVTSGLSVTADRLTTMATYTITVTAVDGSQLQPNNGPQSLTLQVDHHYTVGGGGIALLTLAGLIALWSMGRLWRVKRADLQ